MSHLKNRPEIDGLRAIAVVPVVLYHAAMGFPGGYVGVDIFFVISGYLITALILKDLAGGTFRIVDFWERRVRRILPALALVVAACVVAAWFLFIPPDFTTFGRSVEAQSLLISNLYFWRTTDYFTSTEAQPLLHTWSLAVEEQFYILFPFLLIALKQFARPTLVAVLAVAAVVSFGLSVYALRSHPPAAFYLLPSRAWELLLGSLLAAAPRTRQPARWLDECWSGAGLLAILGAIFGYDRNTPFPGTAALLPCLGAGLIIWSNSSTRTWVGRLLSLRPVAFVGLISYSLYLWHWPALIFSRYRALGELSAAHRLAVVALSFGLATLSWKFVETPFRKRAFLRSRRKIFSFAGMTIATLLIAGIVIHRQNGFRSRWQPNVLRYVDGRDDEDFRIELGLPAARRGELIPIGDKETDRPIDLLVWGDSHAMAVLHVLDAMGAESNLRGVAATHSSTAPLLGFVSTLDTSLKGDSVPYNQAIFDFARKKRIKNVLLVGRWNIYVSAASAPKAKGAFESALTGTIDALHRIGARVFILKDVPPQPFDVPRILAIAAAAGHDASRIGVSIDGYRSQTAYENGLFDRLADDSVIVLDPAKILTDDTGLVRAEKNGRALYFDRHHLTTYGAMQLRPVFQPLFAGVPPGSPEDPRSPR